MEKKVFLTVVFSSLIVFSLISFGIAQETSPVRVGDPFPPFSLENNLSTQEINILQLPKNEFITLEDFNSEILLIELLNVHCHTCKEQVPVFNQLWDSLQSDKILKNRATLIGITVGNNTQEIAAFQKSFEPRYPIIADPSKEVFDSLGNTSGTPQTYLLRKDPSGGWFILYHHAGPVNTHEIYLRKIEELYKTDLEGLEPGYKVPRLLLTTLKKKFTGAFFENKRMLLYFPPLDTFPLVADIRNSGPQMEVLYSFIDEEKLATVIIGAPNRTFPQQELEKAQKTSTIFLLADEGGALARRFEVGDAPLVCLVNNSGRIVYRAPSLDYARAEEVVQGKVTRLTPNLTREELLKLMQDAMRKVDNTIERVEKKELDEGGTIYLGFVNAETRDASLFGRIVSKYSICDICHDVHFYYLFDHNGRLVYFNPINLTKFGNVNWDLKDVEKLKSGVAGKDLFKTLPFDPYVDAVSQATMTSYLIFEGLNETKSVLKGYSGGGFRKTYWRTTCLHNLCEIQKILAKLEKKAQADSLTLGDNTTLDTEKLKQYLPSPTSAQCPTGGNYLLMGKNPLCSVHGMNLEPCQE
jgi:peroxiredoxin